MDNIKYRFFIVVLALNAAIAVSDCAYQVNITDGQPIKTNRTAFQVEYMDICL
jgi:hypothetical protein